MRESVPATWAFLAYMLPLRFQIQFWVLARTLARLKPEEPGDLAEYALNARPAVLPFPDHTFQFFLCVRLLCVQLDTLRLQRVNRIAE